MQALLYKEWLKLKPYWLLILLGNLAFCGYLFLDIRHQFRVEHAEMLYYQASQIGRLFYADLRYVPLITGIALAVAQFAPEIIKGRLRLSMHLPVPLAPLVLAHIAIGLVALGVVLGLDMAALAITVGVFFPGAFVASALETALPWMLAGVAGYLGGALVMLEPIRRHQVSYLALTVGVVWLFHLSTRYEAYDRALPGLILLVVLTVPAILLSAIRFRDGGR